MVSGFCGLDDFSKTRVGGSLVFSRKTAYRVETILGPLSLSVVSTKISLEKMGGKAFNGWVWVELITALVQPCPIKSKVPRLSPSPSPSPRPSQAQTRSRT